MAYYAKNNGLIYFKTTLEEVLHKLQEEKPILCKYNNFCELILNEFNINIDSASLNDNYIEFYNDCKYRDIDYKDMFDLLGKYIEQPANIEFTGEDDYIWRLEYKNGILNENPGNIIYNPNCFKIKQIFESPDDKQTKNAISLIEKLRDLL